MANTTKLDSFFTEYIIDNNNKSVIDLNAGLSNLYEFFNENYYNMEESQNYLVSSFEDSYPDLLASHSILGSQKYWWWILLLNKLDDALEDIKENWAYGIPSEEQITNFLNNSNKKEENSPKSRIGSVIELN